MEIYIRFWIIYGWMFYDFVNLYWNNLNFEYFICSTFNNLGFNSRVKNGRNLSKFYFKYYNRTILNLTRDQILILFKQLYNKSNCFSRDWQSFLILFISFFFFLFSLQLDLSHENEIAEKFGTRLIVSHQTRARELWQI